MPSQCSTANLSCAALQTSHALSHRLGIPKIVRPPRCTDQAQRQLQQCAVHLWAITHPTLPPLRQHKPSNHGSTLMHRLRSASTAAMHCSSLCRQSSPHLSTCENKQAEQKHHQLISSPSCTHQARPWLVAMHCTPLGGPHSPDLTPISQSHAWRYTEGVVQAPLVGADPARLQCNAIHQISFIFQ